MGFVDAIKSGFNKYVGFSDRAARSEYWYWILFYFIALFVASFLDAFLGIGFLGAIVSLGMFLPSLAVAVRRLHDLDKSGWFVLIGLIPLIGLIILIVWYCTKGTTGPNRFGPDPLGGM